MQNTETIDCMVDSRRHDRPWWKGSFPLWIVVMLLGLVSYFLQREVMLNDELRKTTAETVVELRLEVRDLQVRVLTLEKNLHDHHQVLLRVEKDINAALTKR